jgi:hypothetical protein
MRYVLYVMILAGVLTLVLSITEHVWIYGGQGYFLLGLCVVPVVLGGIAAVQGRCPRWISGVSAVAFLVAAMKTTEAPLDNIMMAAALGLVLAIVLAIRPPRMA